MSRDRGPADEPAGTGGEWCVRFTGDPRVWNSRSVPCEPDEDLQTAPARNVETQGR